MSDRIGKFFLKQRGAKGTWRICWYEDRQTRSRSCDTSDHQLAQRLLLEHAFEHEQAGASTDESLAAVLARYYQQHAGALPSGPATKLAIRHAMKVWGEDANLSELDRHAQLRFVQIQRDAGLSDWTIQLQLGRVWAGIQWAKRDNSRLIVPEQIKAADWKPLLSNREIVYTPQQLGRLLSAAAEHERWWRFVILAIGTAGRITSIMELKWEQIDMRLNRIALNPEGRRQTKKRRATVPVSGTLAAELSTWREKDQAASGGDVSGRAVLGADVSGHAFFDYLRKKAGIPGSANAIRHTVRTWMAEQDVPDMQADMFMGHKGAGSHTGARYTHRRPEYLAAAAASIDALFAAVEPHISGPRALQPRVNLKPADVQMLDMSTVAAVA